MNKEIISGHQAIAILIMFLFGSSLVIGVSPESKQDAWISILLALLMFTPVIMTYIRIVKLYPGKNLYDIVVDVFGIVIGKTIVLFYVLYAIYLGALVIRNFTEFINIVAMPETPQVIIQVILIVFFAYMVKSGIEALGRWSKFVLPVTISIIIGTFVIALSIMNFNNLKPVDGVGFGDIVNGAFSAFSFPLAESVLFLALFGSVKTNDSPHKIYITGTLVVSLLIIAANIRNVCTIGVPNMGMSYFPSHTTTSVLSIDDFFSRFEALIGISYLLTGSVKVCVCLFAASIGMAKIFNIKNYKTMAYPAGLLMITLATIVYKNATEMFDWLETYKYFSLPFQVILPLIILVGAEIKTRLKKYMQQNQ